MREPFILIILQAGTLIHKFLDLFIFQHADCEFIMIFRGAHCVPCTNDRIAAL